MTDFQHASRTPTASAEDTALYQFFDSANALLYVGITDDPKTRFRVHRRKADWWKDVARYTITWYEHRTEAAAEELRIIREDHPRHNVTGTKEFVEQCRRRSLACLVTARPLLTVGIQPVDPNVLASRPLWTADYHAVAMIEHHREQMGVWKRARAERIAREYDAGKSVEEIAAELSLSAATVYEVMRAARPQPKKPGRRKGQRPAPTDDLATERFEEAP